MKFLILLFLSVAFLSPIAQSHAYGGAGGVGPGWFGSPVKKECYYEPRTIFNRTFVLKRCEVTRDRDFHDRVRAFVERVKHGGSPHRS